MEKELLGAIAPPPRKLSFKVRQSTHFGSRLSFIVMLFLIAPAVLTWVFDPLEMIETERKFDGDVSIADGWVTDSYLSNWGDEDEDIYAVEYEFTAADGSTYHDTAWAFEHVDNDNSVTVEYITGEPSISRVRGMRDYPAGVWTPILIPIIFSVGGAVALTIAFLRNRRNRRVLEKGEFDTATFIDKHPTSAIVNNKPLYLMRFEYEVGGKRYETTTKTIHPEKLEDDEEELLVYNPNDPSEAYLIDNLPGSVELRSDGTFVAKNKYIAVIAVFAPYAILASYALYVLSHFVPIGPLG